MKKRPLQKIHQENSEDYNCGHITIRPKVEKVIVTWGICEILRLYHRAGDTGSDGP
jgi:hypothetical protein